MQELMRFQTDRELHKQEYSENNEAMNILEEVFEAWGYDIPKEKRTKVLMPILGHIDAMLRASGVKRSNPSFHDKVDAYNDIIVFAVGAIMKLGCNPIKTIAETGKEINSRKGEIVNGKFEKYKGKKYTDKWYRADFNICKLKDYK